jgi:hypothetical protein
VDGIKDVATYIAQSLAQGVPLVPSIIAIAALVNLIAKPPTRWKPAIAATIGIALGGLLFLRVGSLWYDGMWVGLVASLVAMELWSRGTFEEEKPRTSTLTQTTTLTTPPEPVVLPVPPQ